MNDTSDAAPLPSLAETLEAVDRESQIGTLEPAPARSAGDDREAVIQFTLGTLRFGLPLSHAVEIGRHPRVTPLPNLPGWVMGVSNVRGEIVSMVDLAAFLGLDRPRPGANRRFILVRNPEMRVGLVVDRILGIRSLDPARQPSEAREEATWHRFVREELPLEEGVLHRIDVEALLAASEMTAFRLE